MDQGNGSQGDTTNRLVRRLGEHQDPASRAEAAAELSRRYVDRLTPYAHGVASRHGLTPRFEGEDAVNAALDVFCRRVAAGRFAGLDDRDAFRKLILKLIRHEIGDELERRRALRRRGDAVSLETVEVPPDPSPGPYDVVAARDELDRLLDALDDPTLRQVAALRLDGWTVQEIAEHLRCVDRTIRRKLERIRALWDEQGLVER